MSEENQPYDAPIQLEGKSLEEIDAEIREIDEECAKLTEWPDTGHY